jgi:hypothetical protein
LFSRFGRSLKDSLKPIDFDFESVKLNPKLPDGILFVVIFGLVDDELQSVTK